MLTLVKCIWGPKLYRMYKDNQTSGRNYNANSLEFYSSTFIQLCKGFFVFTKWTSPILLAVGYWRGYFTYDYAVFMINLVVFLSTGLMLAQVTRGIGRFSNQDYRKFLVEFLNENTNSISNHDSRKKFLIKYDFDVSKWLPDYVPSVNSPIFKNGTLKEPESSTHKAKFFIWNILARICVSTFGLRMCYPGMILHKMIEPMLIDGRANLIEKKNAQRAIVKLNDSNILIDTLLVDQRNSQSKHGQDLIICCDGNASFYEVGILDIPIQRGFSTLGWNYPGFAQSTGAPYPNNVTSSADAIMQYAFSLGFKVENIILFSWSIGGFPIAWLSNYYPNIKAVILDASFDSIVHLAKQQLPKFATNFTEFAVKTNLNLDILDILKNYNGPLRLIRRTFDEIISTIPRIPSSNLGNDLLIGILKKRYPSLIDKTSVATIRIWLGLKSEAQRVSYYTEIMRENNDLVEASLKSYIDEHGNQYPIEMGKDMSDELRRAFALYLANKYMDSFESSHCQPLPKEYLRLPWTELDLLNSKNFEDDFLR